MAAAAGGESLVRPKQETGLTTYDQKQSGKYNIHLNIKDVAIIALDAGHLDSGVGDFAEDYYEDYDLSDFTVKPIIGLIDITSDKPSSPSSSSTTPAPPLIHFEPDDEDNQNENASNATAIEEPIIKDPVNKTQSVVIINGAASNESGIAVITSTPAPESLPPKLSLADLANIHSASPFSFPIKPDEIPVQIILEQTHKQKQASRQRPNGHWRLRNRIPATPSSNRRITPPHIDIVHDSDDIAANPPISAIGNDKHRKHSFAHAKRRNCVLNQNGQCQNSNRRFGSPTL